MTVNKFIFLFLILATAGCGVKGKPLPPLETAPTTDVPVQKKQKQAPTTPREEQNAKPGVESL